MAKQILFSRDAREAIAKGIAQAARAVKGTLGPHRTEQKNVRPHHNPLDRQGKFFYVPTKGADSVITYRLDAKRCLAIHANEIVARPGAGPRHIDFHPRRAFAYVINELDSTIPPSRQAPASGKLTPLQTVPSTPAEFTGYSTGAEIAVDRTGRHVYVSNRGHDSIGVFAIDPDTGTLAPKQWVPTKGGTPRFFAFAVAASIVSSLTGATEMRLLALAIACQRLIQPRGSASRMVTRWPRPASSLARMRTAVVLPAPPLVLANVSTGISFP